MTANATMYCYPGNAYAGGNVAIHEMGHTLNHLVFEETNETYWYDRIWNIANADRAAGKVPEDYSPHLAYHLCHSMTAFRPAASLRFIA